MRSRIYGAVESCAPASDVVVNRLLASSRPLSRNHQSMASGDQRQSFAEHQADSRAEDALALLKKASTIQDVAAVHALVGQASEVLSTFQPPSALHARTCTQTKSSRSAADTNGSTSEAILQRFRLDDKVALVTGAGWGIGRALAHALGEAGADVAVADISLKAAQTVTEQLQQKGINSIAIETDVSQKANCQRMVEAVIANFGGLHIAVNNAGILRNSAAEDTTEDEWDQVLDVNTKGLFFCCQAEGKHMLAQRYGKIINMASMTALCVLHPQKQVAYNASKAAVAKITQTLGCEWADRGVNVNCLSPGLTNTPQLEAEAVRGLRDEWLTQIPAGRLAEVSDLQAAVVYMASDASSYMVGANLVIDGGHSIW